MTTPTLYHATFEYAGEWDYVFFVADSSTPYTELVKIATERASEMHDDDLDWFKETYGETINVFTLDKIDDYKINLTK